MEIPFQASLPLPATIMPAPATRSTALMAGAIRSLVFGVYANGQITCADAVLFRVRHRNEKGKQPEHSPPGGFGLANAWVRRYG
jgi:hypothetical protein